MAHVFTIRVTIGDDVISERDFVVSKWVDINNINGVRQRGNGRLTNPLDSTKSYIMERFDATNEVVTAVKNSAPNTINIGDAGASSLENPKEIRIIHKESGWYYCIRLYPIPASSENANIAVGAYWASDSAGNTFGTNFNYTPQSTTLDIYAVTKKYTSSGGERVYNGFLIAFNGGSPELPTTRNQILTGEESLYGEPSEPLPQTPTGGAGGFGNRDNRTDVTVNIGTKPSSFLSGILGGSGFNFYFVPSYHDLIRATYYSLNGVNNLSDFVNNTAALFLNPATYIVSAVQIPVDKSAFGAGALRHDIRLGGLLNFNVDCYNLSKLWGDSDTFTFSFDGMYFDNFMDFEPYTKISLLLPYVGVVSLKCSECVGGSVSVKYRFEGLTGKCIAFVYTTDRNGRNTGYYQYSGDAGFSVPWVGNNGGGSQMIHSAASAAVSLASGTADMKTVGDLASTAASFYGNDSRPKMQGGFGVNTGVLGADDIAIFVQRAQNAMPEHYYDIHGYQTATGGVVGDYSGYTQFVYVDLENTTATDSEKAEIESLLKGGVYL